MEMVNWIDVIGLVWLDSVADPWGLIWPGPY